MFRRRPSFPLACLPASASAPRRAAAALASGGASPAPGFTLVEMMVVLAVMVVAMAVALPSMKEFSASNQVVSVRGDFASSLALARTEAAKRGLPVLVQAVGTGGSGNEFANGWELVVDENGDGAAGSSELRVRRYKAIPIDVRLGGTSPLVFRATGSLTGNSDQAFRICRASGSSLGYSVTVTPSGGADVASISNCS